ncbi:MAG: dihydroorotase [Betaproteobacteria bacterium]|nr:MAG: dihydroorotase [Betaproteobacteria bacterium]
MKITLRGGRVIDPAAGRDEVTDVFIAAGKIAAIGSAPSDWHANKEINAAGCVVAPGLVDLAVHVKRGTLATELAAAAAGGVTSMVCLPDTDPVLDEPGLVDMLRFRAQSFHSTHVYPLGALTKALAGSQLSELSKLAEAGCVGFGQAETPILDTQVLLRAMQYAATYDYAVWLRPQDPHLSREGTAHDGEVASRLGLVGIPVAAETIALTTHIELARATGVRLHVCRVSCAQSVELIRRAKSEGLRITADVSINHVHLIDLDVGFFDSNFHLTPPLRSSRDRDALIAGLIDGTLDAIVSDHTPRPSSAKQVPFSESAPGASGLELLLSLSLRLAESADIDLSKMLNMLTARPAKAAALSAAGSLAIGASADLCVFDPGAYRLISAASMRSAGKNTPFLGYELPGVVRATVAAGYIAYESVA